MENYKFEKRGVHCWFCATQVQYEGNVCPQCEPKYLSIGKILFEYSKELEPILQASPCKQIYVAMRFVINTLLEELALPIPYSDK